MKLKTITSVKLAKRLINEGFIVMDIKPHKDNPDRSVFLFRDTPELNNFIILRDSYKNNKKINNL